VGAAIRFGVSRLALTGKASFATPCTTKRGGLCNPAAEVSCNPLRSMKKKLLPLGRPLIVIHKSSQARKADRVGKALASPPSEPCGRFSRTRLSSRQFPHRDGLANGFPRANPPFRVTATARKSSAGLQPWAGLDRSRFSGHLPEGYPVRLTVSVPAFPPSYPPSLWAVLLPALYHPFRPMFRLVGLLCFRLVSRRCHNILAMPESSTACSTMRVLTPARVRFPCRHPRLLHITFRPFRPQPHGAPGHRLSPSATWPVSFRLRHK
jgi:hypothetical protein